MQIKIRPKIFEVSMVKNGGGQSGDGKLTLKLAYLKKEQIEELIFWILMEIHKN